MKTMRFTSAFRAAALACVLAVPAASFADTPDAYLDYVESTGSQWIDTGVNGETGLKFVADLAWDTSHNGRADWMLGVNEVQDIVPEDVLVEGQHFCGRCHLCSQFLGSSG